MTKIIVAFRSFAKAPKIDVVKKIWRTESIGKGQEEERDMECV